MDSTSARAWAAGALAGSTAAKLILILLADKADEAGANYSCAPSIRSLVAESGAGRSTVLRALKELETRGLISRYPQFGEDGARLSTRYFLNHSAQARPAADGDIEPPSLDARATTELCAAAANSQGDSLPRLLSVPHAAQLLGISKATAYRWAARGDLPVRRLGSRIYVQTMRLRGLLDEVTCAAVAAQTSCSA